MPITVPGMPKGSRYMAGSVITGLNLHCLQTLGEAAVVVGDPQVVAKGLGAGARTQSFPQFQPQARL